MRYAGNSVFEDLRSSSVIWRSFSSYTNSRSTGLEIECVFRCSRPFVNPGTCMRRLLMSAELAAVMIMV